MKKCADCKKSQPTTKFHNQRTGKDGLHPYCKRCVARRSREWRAANPARSRYLGRRAYVRRTYGLELDEYEALLARGCAICASHDRMHLDHDHTSGAVRAGLCSRCNHMIGLSLERPATLRAAADYLETHAA